MSPESPSCKSDAKTWLGGCFLSHLDRGAILERIRQWIVRGSKGHYACAINVSKLVASQRDSKLRAFLANSSVNIADGAPILAATRWVGNPIPERVTGVELMEDLLQLADQQGYSVYFFGSKQQILDKVVARCVEEFPGAVVAGARNGYFSAEEESAIVSEIAAANADILLIALGVPQKEYFLDDHNNDLNVSLSLPVGGAFDVYAGEKKRAPGWVQRFGVEWLWRSAYDLSRARMVLKSAFPFIGIVLREIFSQRLTGKKK